MDLLVEIISEVIGVILNRSGERRVTIRELLIIFLILVVVALSIFIPTLLARH